jgi:hypothetical protein
VLRERLASPDAECPSHALGLPCQVQRERQLRVKILAISRLRRGAAEAKSGVESESGEITDSAMRQEAEEDGLDKGGVDRLHERWIGWLDERGLVRVVFVEVVGGFVDALRAGGVPDQKSSCGSRHAPDEPNELFHACFPSVLHYQ